MYSTQDKWKNQDLIGNCFRSKWRKYACFSLKERAGEGMRVHSNTQAIIQATSKKKGKIQNHLVYRLF